MKNLDQVKLESLTLRDQIALSALKAVNSDDNYISLEDEAKALGIRLDEYDPKVHWPYIAAKQCYAFADAFLNEREVIQNKIADDIEEMELWRDLSPDDIIQEGDRELYMGCWRKSKSLVGLEVGDCIVQRRVRKEDL